jgi:hypothetical protein
MKKAAQPGDKTGYHIYNEYTIFPSYSSTFEIPSFFMGKR